MVQFLKKNLTLALANLNSRIRSRGLSAREMFTQRDQFTNKQINLADYELIMTQHKDRFTNHPFSEKSKAPSGKLPKCESVEVGDLVFLYCDRNKNTSRDRYLVTSTDGNWCNIRKLVGSQLRNATYRVKKSECYKVPHIEHKQPSCDLRSYDDSDDDVAETPSVNLQTNEIDSNSQSHIPTEIIHSTCDAVLPEPDFEHAPDSSQSINSATDGNEQPLTLPRRSTRIRRQPEFYGDRITYIFLKHI